MSTYGEGDTTEISAYRQLVQYFVPQFAEQGRLGVEWEQLPLDPSNRMVPFEGDVGVQALLRRIGGRHDIVLEEGRITALRLLGGGVIGLEPGGQLEVASPPLGNLNTLFRFLARTFKELNDPAKAMGFRLVPWGLVPYGEPEDLPDVPKARYRLLREHLEKTGPRGRRMMKQTAATQFCLDYEDERDMARKVGAVLRILPYLVAFTANSPVAGGRRTRWLSQRPWIWRGTDAMRCGLPRFLFREDLQYADFVRYALSRPVLFVVRHGQYLRGDGRSFRDWWKSPGEAGPLTLDDWAVHQSTLFPDIRLRDGYLEVRSLDSAPLPVVLGCAALWKGLLCNEESLSSAEALGPLPTSEGARESLLAAARYGPRWKPAGAPEPRELMLRLLDSAALGLSRMQEYEGWLTPLRQLVDKNICPADLWRKDVSGIWWGPEDPDPVF